MQEQICKAIAEEEQPEIIAANKAQGRKVFDELQQRQQEFADVVTALRVAHETRALSLQDICDRPGSRVPVCHNWRMDAGSRQ